MTSGMVAAVFVGTIVLVAAVIWLVPRAQARRWRRVGISSEERLAELTVQARTGITQALGGLALVATLALTAYQVNETRRSSDNNLHLATQSQVSERFSRAVEQLGSKDDSVRTGALFSLLHIGRDSKEHAESAFLVVATYVTRNYEPHNEGLRGCDSFRLPRTDIRTALTFVLPPFGALLRRPGEPTQLGLRGIDLSGLGLDALALSGFNLTQIKLPETNLQNADFSESTLVEANFNRACLRGADFQKADLQGASLKDADLRNAQLDGADLRNAQLDGANLHGANLERAKFTEVDLDHASLSEEQKRDIIIV